ncbi:MAG TPA: hypothetical protein VFS75_03520 [Candidatus Paceibacterota bacterium]|nr:hypothetical protein [Candidatus Paceibacterota bacterium]
MDTIRIVPLGPVAEAADRLMAPLMVLLSGHVGESPQRTHRWNNTKLRSSDITHLDPFVMVHEKGRQSRARWWGKLPVFHMPVVGWKDYIVLRPVAPEYPWHVGWITDDVIGVSRIEVRGQVRLLIGPGDVTFFGVDHAGAQVAVVKDGEGRLGDGSRFRTVPLL